MIYFLLILFYNLFIFSISLLTYEYVLRYEIKKERKKYKDLKDIEDLFF